ncbi:MAG: hypothetical protein EBT27_09475 [Betaproteobacteria bacterium]|nr:hypothetical protein [Betaproteobacteria bacterium]
MLFSLHYFINLVNYGVWNRTLLISSSSIFKFFLMFCFLFFKLIIKSFFLCRTHLIKVNRCFCRFSTFFCCFSF